MSTFVVVRKGDEICIAADTLSIFDGTEEFAGFVANTDKLVQVGKAWIAFDGPVAARLAATHHFAQKSAKRHLYDPLSIFETLSDLALVLSRQGLTLPASLIVSSRGIFRAGADRSVVELTRFEALGTGRRYALGAMHAVYDALGSAEAVAMAGLEAASRFDPASELPMTRYTLRVAGKEKEKRPKRRREPEEAPKQPKGYGGDERALEKASARGKSERKAPAQSERKGADLESVKQAPYFGGQGGTIKISSESAPTSKAGDPEQAAGEKIAGEKIAGEKAAEAPTPISSSPAEGDQA